MKYFFYTILLVASLGTFGAIVNPPLAQRGAALIGLGLPWTSSSPVEKATDEEKLAPFLEQYPSFANAQNNATVPTTAGSMILYPEPAPAAMLPVYAAPSTPFPTPVAEPVATVYATPIVHERVQSPADWTPSDWDSTATMPIESPSAVEAFLPITPVQEPTPASTPLHSVYVPTSINQPFPSDPVAPVPPPSAFPFVENLQPVGFASSKVPAPQPQPQPIQVAMVSPPPTTHTIPATQPPTPYVPPTTATLQTPAVLVEEVPVHGTEMVARVGTRVILMGDILPKLRRTARTIVAMNLEKMSEAERANIPPKEIEKGYNEIATALYPDVLQEQILFTLVYSDYISQQSNDQKNFFDEKLGDEFDRKEVPELLKEFNVENAAALKQYLEHQLGSSLDKEKRQWIREQIVRQWIGMSIDKAAPAPTHDEMMEFYERNQAMFTSTAKTRWQEMLVLFSRHSTEAEAWDKIKWMGNQVATNRVSFEEIAKTQSDGFTSSEGGVRDWTSKGSLTSAELEQAIFSQPVGQLSPTIIKSDIGLHIVKVLERKESTVTPFGEAQVIIRERIKNQRTQRHQDEYLTELRRRFPTVVVRDRIDFDISNARTANSAL